MRADEYKEMLATAGVITALLAGCGGPITDFNQPLFADAGTPFCNNMYEVEDYLDHVRAGNAQAPKEYSCAVLEYQRDVIFNGMYVDDDGMHYAKVLFQLPNGKRTEFVWTKPAFLHN
nr:hypothetical protein [uncultured Rhodopila sp.]